MASLVTWFLTQKAFKSGGFVKKIPVMIESDGESEESEMVRIELDTSRKYYVSSSGRKLRIFPECLGRRARVSHYKMCINCANRFTDRSTTSTTTRRLRRSNSKRG